MSTVTLDDSAQKEPQLEEKFSRPMASPKRKKKTISADVSTLPDITNLNPEAEIPFPALTSTKKTTQDLGDEPEKDQPIRVQPLHERLPTHKKIEKEPEKPMKLSELPDTNQENATLIHEEPEKDQPIKMTPYNAAEQTSMLQEELDNKPVELKGLHVPVDQNLQKSQKQTPEEIDDGDMLKSKQKLEDDLSNPDYGESAEQRTMISEAMRVDSKGKERIEKALDAGFAKAEEIEHKEQERREEKLGKEIKISFLQMLKTTFLGVLMSLYLWLTYKLFGRPKD